MRTLRAGRPIAQGPGAHIAYWAAPAVVALLLIGAYFSGSPALRSLVAPEINRELGLLESAQHLLLLLCCLAAVRGALASRSSVTRVGWLILLAGSSFMLAEELDWGLHYLEWWRGVAPVDRVVGRSFHDGIHTKRLKQLSDTIMVVWFVALPWFAAWRSDDLPGRWPSPSTWLTATVVTSLLASRLAHALEDAGYGAGGALYSGTAEFRELFTYWMWLLYFAELSGSEGANVRR